MYKQISKNRTNLVLRERGQVIGVARTLDPQQTSFRAGDHRVDDRSRLDDVVGDGAKDARRDWLIDARKYLQGGVRLQGKSGWPRLDPESQLVEDYHSVGDFEQKRTVLASCV